MKILATVDGSSLAAEVLPFVGKLARDSHSSIILLTVATHAGQGYYRGYIPAMADSALGSPTTSSTVIPAHEGRTIETHEQALDSAHDEAITHLNQLASGLKKDGLDVAVHAIVSEDVVGSILSHARKEAVDLIAMATHGRSGLRAVVQGSVASAIVRAGEFPVFLVRPRQAPRQP